MRGRRPIAARWCASRGSLRQPLSRDEPSAHFTASAFVIDVTGERTCLVRHAKLGQAAAAGRAHRGERRVARGGGAAGGTRGDRARVELHPTAPRPFDLDIHEIPDRPGEPAHRHLDVRYLVIGRGEPGGRCGLASARRGGRRVGRPSRREGAGAQKPGVGLRSSGLGRQAGDRLAHVVARPARRRSARRRGRSRRASGSGRARAELELAAAVERDAVLARSAS